MRPQNFDKKATGATVNYYFVGEAELDPNTLYMFYNREFCPLMFAWVYLKVDKWVIRTGANQNPLEYANRFFNYVKQKYRLCGEIVKREGLSRPTEQGDSGICPVGDDA